MRRTLLACVLAVLALPAAAAPVTAHFDALETLLGARAADTSLRGRAGRAQRRVAKRTVKRIDHAASQFADDLRTAKAVVKLVERPFRTDADVLASLDETLRGLGDDIAARADYADDVATFDVDDDDRYFAIVERLASARATLRDARAVELPRRRACKLLAAADADVAAAEDLLFRGTFLRNLTGTYAGEWDLFEAGDPCDMQHYGEIRLSLKHKPPAADVTGSATLVGFEVLDGDCEFVREKSRSGPVRATFDGATLTGTFDVGDGYVLEFAADLDGGTLEGDFVPSGDGGFRVDRE